jgi:transposase
LTDDQTHRDTWDLLCHIAGRSDFLYVADSKLATQANMEHLHQNGGRFVTVLPRTRREDRMFREQVHKGTVKWKSIFTRKNQQGVVTEQVFAAEQPMLSAEGYRIHWLRSSRKADQDRSTRQRALDRAWAAFAELRERLASPRTRFRTHAKVEEAVSRILEETGTRAWIEGRIYEYEDEQFRQVRPGRAGPKTTYRKVSRTRFDIEVELNQENLEQEAIQDGIFPIITNDHHLPVREVLAAYKRQPVIEKRFSQLKSELLIAPVYLHNAGRIEALLCVYFFALLAQTLIERETRHKMAEKGVASLRLYHENRPSKQPTARRVLDAFGNVQRHLLVQPHSRIPTELVTELSPLQRQILELLDIPRDSFGRRPTSTTPKTRAKAR